MSDNSVSGRFNYERACVNSHRFKPDDEQAKKITNMVYLMNDSYIALGEPDSIKVEVSEYPPRQ